VTDAKGGRASGVIGVASPKREPRGSSRSTGTADPKIRDRLILDALTASKVDSTCWPSSRIRQLVRCPA
jgi:hypothetical protein